MAKKLICFPFVNGDLQEYSYHDLDDEQRERVYNGEEVILDYPYNKNFQEVWKPNAEVELTLHYKGYGRGRSAVTFYWEDDNGHTYPMFIKDVDELLKENMGTSNIHAIFTFVKRGANYGIKFVKRVKQIEKVCRNCIYFRDIPDEKLGVCEVAPCFDNKMYENETCNRFRERCFDENLV